MVRHLKIPASAGMTDSGISSLVSALDLHFATGRPDCIPPMTPLR